MRRSVLIWSSVLAALLLGCAQESRAPVIESFRAAPASLEAGGDVTLSWQVSGADGLTIEPDIGAVTGSSVTVRVTETRTFTLTARGKGGSVSRDLTVTVAAGGSRPYVTAVYPASGATGVRADVRLLIEFSAPMARRATEGAYASDTAGLEPGNVDFAWNPEGTILTVTPRAPLAYARGADPATTTALTYTFAIGAGATDLGGNPMAARQFSFSTYRSIAATLDGDPAQDGSVDAGGVSNDLFALQVSPTSTGYYGFSLNPLPAGLEADRIAAATLLVNGSYPCGVDPNTVRVEHVSFGPTLTSAAVSTAALHQLGYLAPDAGCWHRSDVLTAVRDDWEKRLGRGSRSQYRLSCSACSITFYAAEAADSGGDASGKVPSLEVEYLVP